MLLAIASFAQVTPPAEPFGPDTTVATLDGYKVTASELQALMLVLPRQAQENAIKNPKGFLSQIAMTRRAAEMAVNEKLDQKSPYKQQLEFQRNVILFQAMADERQNRILVSAEDAKKYYEEIKDRFNQVRIKVIYVAFTKNPSPEPASGKKPLTEPEAKEKIEKLLAELREGADFVKLAKQHSDDIVSAEKEAELGTIRASDKIDEPIKSVIFKLKKGELSEPVRAPNGYYIFRAEEVTLQPYEQVSSDVVNELRSRRASQWIEELQKSVKVTVDNEAFFRNPTGSSQAPAGK